MKTVMKAMMVAAALVVMSAALEQLGNGKLEMNQAHADDQYITTVSSTDAGASTATLCVGPGTNGLYGQNTTIDVLCNARFCYKTSGDQSTTSATQPTPATDCSGQFLYDGGAATQILNEGIRSLGPPARIQLGRRPCISFTSPDNGLDAGTPHCSVWRVLGINGGVDPRP